MQDNSNIKSIDIANGNNCSFSENISKSNTVLPSKTETDNKQLNNKSDEYIFIRKGILDTNTLITIKLVFRYYLINVFNNLINGYKVNFFSNLKHILLIKQSNQSNYSMLNLLAKTETIYLLKKMYLYYHNKKIVVKIQKKIKHWRNISVYNKLSENLAIETENKIINRHKNKNTSMEMNLSKLNSNILCKNEELEKYQYKLDAIIKNTNKINNEYSRLCLLSNNNKTNLRVTENKQNSLNNLNKEDCQYIQLNKKYSDLQNKISEIKQQMVEKDYVINSYINEQNNVLDIQEKMFYDMIENIKISNLSRQTKKNLIGKYIKK